MDRVLLRKESIALEQKVKNRPRGNSSDRHKTQAVPPHRETLFCHRFLLFELLYLSALSHGVVHFITTLSYWQIRVSGSLIEQMDRPFLEVVESNTYLI
jgi:hypothetical protein